MKLNASAMTSKFMNRMFRRIDGVVWDLTTGNQGLQDPNGIYTIEKIASASPAVRARAAVEATATTEAVEAIEAAAATKAQFRVSVNPFEQFGMAIPAFATIVAFDNIKEKDIVVGDKGILGWVIDKKEVALTLMDLNGMTKNFTPPKVAIGGQDGVLVVQSLTGLAGDGFAGLQGSLLPLMMMGGDTADLGDILPLLLFSQTQGAGDGASAAMLPQLLMMKALGGKSEGGSSIDKLLPLMLMGGLGGGNGGINPMALMLMGGLGGDDSPLPLTQTRRNGAPPLFQTR